MSGAARLMIAVTLVTVPAIVYSPSPGASGCARLRRRSSSRGGFFGLAHVPGFRFLLYAGATLVTYSTVATAVGLFRA